MEDSANTNKAVYKRLLIRGGLVIVGVAILIFIVPTLIRVLLPFLIASIGAIALNPLINKLNQKIGISRRMVAVVLDLFVFLLVFSLLGILVYSIINEVISLAMNIQQNWDEIVVEMGRFGDGAQWLLDMLPPQAADILDNLEEGVVDFIQSASKNVVNSAFKVTASATTKAGNFFVVFIVTILAAYFIMVDYSKITTRLESCVGGSAKGHLLMLKKAVFSAAGGYVRSQLLLALFAFVFMLIALVIYGQPYALLIALFLGFIDLLPIVGTIAVLVPWGLIEGVAGNMSKGVFLIVLGVVYFLARKVVEPKIVGSQTGLHPLLALMSAYVGLQLLGVWGAILGPMAVMIVISIYRAGVFDSTIADLKIVVRNISQALKR